MEYVFLQIIKPTIRFIVIQLKDGDKWFNHHLRKDNNNNNNCKQSNKIIII